MVKNKQYRIDFVKNIKGKKVKEEIKLEENTLIRLYITYKKINFKDNMKLHNIIKYLLSAPGKKESISSKAFKELVEGIEVDGVKYLPLITSPGMMKKEESRIGKCEYLFIAEEDKEFIELYQKLISLNKISKMKNKEIVINKDIVARTGLALSNSYKIEYKPNVVILPSDSYIYRDDYVTIDKEGKLQEVTKDGEHEFADGCGFMSNRMSEIIANQLNVDYNVDFAIIRMYNGLATKGLVIRADWNKFFDDNYKYKKDVFEKREDGYYTKDCFGNMVNISKADLILNTNMCKWAKNWQGEVFEDINVAIDEELDKCLYKAYKDILESLYVTKINKKKLNTHTAMSYQVLNNTALLDEELREMQKNTEGYLDKVSSGNIDSVRLFLNDIAHDEEFKLNASTKLHRCIQAIKGFEKTGVARRTMNNQLLKSVHLVAGGKPYIKGNYKYSFIDPICYLRWIMCRNIEESRELKEREFYVNNEYGKRVLTRNPLAVFSEVHKIQLIKNDIISKYFGDLTNEIIFFNQSDDTAFISSGEDFDGDFNGVWEDSTLYNAVIDTDRHFFNTDDGSSFSTEYTDENMYKCILMASGNLIGSIANITTKISNLAQEYKYVDVSSKKAYTYKELKEIWLNKEENKVHKRKLDKDMEDLESLKTDKKLVQYNTESEINRLISEATDRVEKDRKTIYNLFGVYLDNVLESGEFFDTIKFPKEDKRKYLKMQFNDLKEDMYYALFQTQRAIDAPKTCVFPTKEDLEKLDKYKKMKHPTFIYYAKYTKNYDSGERVDKKDTTYTRTALNINANRMNKGLIKKVKAKKINNDNEECLYKFISEFSKKNEECCLDIKALYEEYNNKRLEVKKEKEEDRDLEYTKADKYILSKAEAYECHKYTPEEVAYALVKNKCTTNFIFKFFWNTIEKIIDMKERDVYMYKEDVDGELDYMFKRYTKVQATLRDNKLQEKYKKELDKKLTHTLNIGKFIEIDIKEGETLTVKVEDYFNERQKKNIKQAAIFNSEDQKIGFVFQNTAELSNGKNIIDYKDIKVEKVIPYPKYIAVTINI